MREACLLGVLVPICTCPTQRATSKCTRSPAREGKRGALRLAHGGHLLDKTSETRTTVLDAYSVESCVRFGALDETFRAAYSHAYSSTRCALHQSPPTVRPTATQGQDATSVRRSMHSALCPMLKQQPRTLHAALETTAYSRPSYILNHVFHSSAGVADDQINELWRSHEQNKA